MEFEPGSEVAPLGDNKELVPPPFKEKMLSPFLVILMAATRWLLLVENSTVT
jgi:hypothetical protein